ncbi:TBC domain-containing protein [Colletotrichum abscissum]|uniref:TBC domain-containing protein n=1 Tax=Colletotrichum abscissum TaxID=1671311 RepID=A0A9P9XM81_9PEZI|nr:TBC domain-containing protein [Colletotrichum abscissum]KAI3556344.1 TBC domain-containing protein [Colletotrichum abscissum]KAK1507416.1 TBC domain-containing protein [Colletotrichum abscissum]
MDPALQQRDEVDHNTELTHAKPDTRPAAADANANQDDDDHRETTPKMLAHDSMVTVRLSEPPTLTLDTNVGPDSPPRRRPSTVKIEKLPFPTETLEVKAQNQPEDETDNTPPSDPTTPLPVTNATRNLQDELVDCEDEAEEEGDRITSLPARGTLLETPIEFKRPVVDEAEEEDEEEVNWDELQKSEAQEPRDADTDRSTAMLLAMLEQENDKLATNPKTIKVQAVEQVAASNRPRPPSMAQLRHMVHGPTPPALRYSMLPPPPMTDLEFYAALVKDYQQTAARLPTLLSNKIRKGIPPPLRGVVWQSMAGARDSALEEQYERFTGESSPYEPIIGKDLGRSFPGVDMFRDPEGDGQRMLGRVLKCFSLYDTKIGYCQGLAFLVGPLLMHMPDKQAFCVLVRLMERYDLRSCFLPDLSGLHVRIYQFRELLREHMTPVSNHLEELQVDPAYVSQWFLSFFAVTCPLPMLFRIYDVIFAEGAPETLMRVALSLMQKNQARILACTELEDVMQLLLSRGLWDCYHYNADEFVQDFVSLSGVVTRETLLQLEQGYRDAQIASANAARTSDVTTAASRFLGRIWASSTIISPKSSSTLSPGLTAPSRPLSMLRRSTSKQSLASTLNSMEASSVSVLSSASTEATTVSRDSSNTDSASIRESTPIPSGGKAFNGGKNNKENALHTQIEDLLTALTELQRNHASLANELQKEREQREDDKQAVRSLLDGLRKKASNDSVGTDASVDTLKATDDPANEAREGGEGDVSTAKTGEQDTPSPGDLSQLLDNVEERFGRHPGGGVERRMSRGESKSQMQQELQQLKDQLASAVSQSQDYNRKMHDLEQEITTLKDQVRESHSHTRILHQDKQRLEKQIHTMRARASAAGAESNTQPDGDSPVRKSSASGASGLRELKLGRSKSTPSQAGSIFSKRSSSMPKPHDSTPPPATQAPPPVPAPPPTDDQHEALLLELVQAKTSEAIARQEAEETKQKLESLRKAYSLVTGEAAQAQPAATAAGAAASAAMGVFGRLTGAAAEPVKPVKPATPTPVPAAAAAAAAAAPAPAAGGFWGWRR